MVSLGMAEVRLSYEERVMNEDFIVRRSAAAVLVLGVVTAAIGAYKTGFPGVSGGLALAVWAAAFTESAEKMAPQYRAFLTAEARAGRTPGVLLTRLNHRGLLAIELKIALLVAGLVVALSKALGSL